MAVTASYLEIPPIVNLQGNPCIISATTSLANASDIYMHLRIQELVAGVWTDTLREDARTLIDGSAIFDISGYFENLFTPIFSFPEHFTNLILPRPEMIKAFRVKIWESYLDADGILQDKESDSLQLPQTTYMIPGGISDDDIAVINEISSDWWTEHQESGRALNWMPAKKIVSVQSIEKIYWLQASYEKITLRFSWISTTGETGTYDYSLNIAAFCTYEFSVSPALLESITGKEIASYTVSLVGKKFSQGYQLDRTYYEWNEHFILANSFQCYETIWCRGSRTGKINYSRQNYEKVDRSSLKLFDRTSGNIRSEFSRVHESKTGFYTENAVNWIDWTVDLLNSDDVYTVDGFKIFPVKLNSESIDFEDQFELGPISLSFEWQYARKGKYWSNLGIVAKFINPPYYLVLAAFFYRKQQNLLIDKINGLTASFNNSVITWPQIPGLDIFNLAKYEFWDNTEMSWFDSGNVRTWPLTSVIGYAWALYGKNSVHSRLFHRDFSSKIKDIIPVLVYGREMTEEEQQVILDWLEWYVSIFDVNNNLMTDKDNSVITSSRIL